MRRASVRLVGQAERTAEEITGGLGGGLPGRRVNEEDMSKMNPGFWLE